MRSRRGILFCIVGPTASGKTTLAHKVLAKCAHLDSGVAAGPGEHHAGLSRSISVTSRAPRAGEQHKKDYFFVERSEFIEKKDRGEFFEWEEIHGNYYGTPKSSLEKAIGEGNDLLLVIDIKGAVSVKKSYPDDTIVVFVLPPHREELIRRIKERSVISDEELSTRLATADRETQWLLDLEKQGGVIDYLVVNEDLEHAVEQVESMLVAERLKVRRQDQRFIRAQAEKLSGGGTR